MKSLQRRFKDDPDVLSQYDNIIKEQLQSSVIERIPEDELTESTCSCTVHYMAHHGVVRADREQEN